MHLWLNIFWIVTLLYSIKKVWLRCCLVGLFCTVNCSQWYPLPLISIWFGCAVFSSWRDPIPPCTMPLLHTSYRKQIMLQLTYLTWTKQSMYLITFFRLQRYSFPPSGCSGIHFPLCLCLQCTNRTALKYILSFKKGYTLV